MNAMSSDGKKMISVIVCRPGEQAEITEIDDRLDTMQAIVGGLIQSWDPFYSESDDRYENVAIVCNEEGKYLELEPSRAIFDENGMLLDVIAGPFFICYAPVWSENFESLPADLEDEFEKRFRLPEKFYRTDKGLLVMKYDPNEPVIGRETER